MTEVTADEIEEMAYQSGQPIELYDNVAHIRIAGIEYIAPLKRIDLTRQKEDQ